MMERYCPDCDTNLTEVADDPTKYLHLPGEMFSGVFCVECGRVVMPRAKPEA
jgi:hypothetical protein